MKKIFLFFTLLFSLFQYCKSAIGDTLWVAGRGSYNRQAYGVTFSPDGSKVAASFECPAAAIRIYNTSSGNLDWTKFGPNLCLQYIKYSPDAKYIAVAEETGHIHVWETNSQAMKYNFDTKIGGIYSLDFSPDGTKLLTGGVDDSISIYNFADTTLVKRFGAHAKPISEVHFSPDGATIVSSSDDNTIKLWDATSGVLLRTFSGHTNHVKSVAFTPDGTKLVSCSIDKTVRIWDITTGNSLYILLGHRKTVNQVSIAPNGQFAVTCSDDSTLRVWNINTGVQTAEFGSQYPNRQLTVFVSPNNQKVVSGTTNGSVILWDIAAVTSIAETYIPSSQIRVFQNPVSYKIDAEIILEKVVDVDIALVDLQGKIIQNFGRQDLQVGTNLISLSANSVLSGMYFLQLMEAGKTVSVQKISIIK